MLLLSLVLPLSLLAPSLASGTHNARSEQLTRHRKNRLPAHTHERRIVANGGHVRYVVLH